MKNNPGYEYDKPNYFIPLVSYKDARERGCMMENAFNKMA